MANPNETFAQQWAGSNSLSGVNPTQIMQSIADGLRKLGAIREQAPQAVQAPTLQARPPQDAPIGDGAVRRTADTVNARDAYLRYAIEAAENGQKAAPMNEWMQMQRQQ